MKDPGRLEFYDPLYETIIFERGLPARGFLPDSDDPLDPRDIVQTAELVRLAYLNQVGLAWLVFPSATHTRFAHSIGCWWLGKIAETLIKVRVNTGIGHVSLHKWLDAHKLREEFYLALLLHDVGHGPLSHVLERNPEFLSCLAKAGIQNGDHEHRGAELLLGNGPLVDAWREVASFRFKGTPSLVDLRSRLSDLGTVCLSAICYLMTGNEAYLGGCSHDHRSDLVIVKELVSGLLDLDRLDHYARDSYFSGLRHVAINVRGFLTNLTVQPDDEGALLSLTRDGAAYAAGLLFSKKQIVSAMFRNPKTMALHTMANHGLTAHLRSLTPEPHRIAAALEIAWIQDQQLLDMFLRSESDEAQLMAQRILSVRPYAYVGRWRRDELASRLSKEDVDDHLAIDPSRPSVLIHYDDEFWVRARRGESRDWLDSGRLITDDTDGPLTNHPDHREDFSYLREVNSARYVWLFARDEAEVEALRMRMEGLRRNKLVAGSR